MAWPRSLPPHLRISSDRSSESTISRRQAILCRTSFLHARILLFRPILAKFCLPEPQLPATDTLADDSLTQRVMQQCSNLCLMAAHDLIAVIYANLDVEPSSPLPAWWYCVFYVYTAATILLAAQIKPVIEEGSVAYSRSESWDHAMTILKSYQRYGESARRCMATLKLLSSKIFETTAVQTCNIKSGPESHENFVNSDSLEDEPQGPEFGMEFDVSGFAFDMNDMSWLDSMAGNL
ncbi:hypothetical protein FOIG_16783 [Fusarium odoratissimum NRRL 54006]|nr:uncharacterized protein FOIG_16783 [Fusarium odoratissimum NRRL 54006]EXL89934.1 hypothetical protein FOIG_16783 [Fusarium odoratissimum NRRL 54006]